jgi:ABC-type sugar transport system ATPase subunit
MLIGIRPEHVALDAGASPALHLSATVERVEQLGAASFLYCLLPGGERLTVHAPGQGRFASGARIEVRLPLEHTHVFETGQGEAVVATG